jgi:predicted membrane protein
MTFSAIPGIEGIVTMEPLSMIFLILVQVGGRYLRIELTPAQQKIINNVVIQSLILFAIILMATKNIVNSLIIVSFVYLCVKILFNENIKLKQEKKELKQKHSLEIIS